MEKIDARKKKGMTRRGMIAAVSYMICAVTLVMFNKAALSSFNFPCANVITLLQMLSSTAHGLLAILRLADVLTFADGSAADVALGIATLVSVAPAAAAGGGGGILGKGGKVGRSRGGRSGFVPLHTLARVLPLSLSYLLYMVVGMASISGVNVPMYTALAPHHSRLHPRGRATAVNQATLLIHTHQAHHCAFAFALLAEGLLASKRHSSYS
ncbi:unnamed protein product [Closterium sp. Yama58-4]|nr:unnamed protein product [Closterium sp. Yama58-4]